ncbi:unnamed protein product [Parajaminaea phylloscopi]
MPPSTTRRSHANAVAPNNTRANTAPGPKAKNKADSTASRVPPTIDDADGDYSTDSDTDDSDDDEEERANFEMDGQDLWAQNYCSVCDCLIEPGAGVGSRRPSSVAPLLASGESSSTTPAASASPVLRSKSGTIKARAPSSESIAAANLTAHGGNAHRMKRSGSSGSGRLTALTDLKPTTRLDADAQSPRIARQTSTVSTRSSTSGTSTPAQSESGATTSVLPRSRKGGLLGGLTPAALKQQEEEELKAKAPPALYCSERCRDIDEERQMTASGLAQLGSYVAPAQPAHSSASYPWQGQQLAHIEGMRVWSRTPSMTSVPAAFAQQLGPRTPDSEYSPCMCADCVERSSGSGTVPSGASDTTEASSNGLPYGRGGVYRKQRSRSGRILTPQNLLPPGYDGTEDGYFPAISARPVCYVGKDSGEAPPRTSSVASAESSARSSESYASMWEPKLARPATQNIASRTIDESQQNRMSMASEQSVNTAKALSGATTPGPGSLGGTQVPVRPSSTTGSLTRGVNPLLLLRCTSNDTRRSAASVDITAEQASSPGASRLISPFGSSLTSEQTLGTSAHTLVQRESSLRERRHARGRSLVLNLQVSTSHSSAHADEGVSPRDSTAVPADRLSQSFAGSHGDALASLRAAASSRGGHHAEADATRRYSTSSMTTAGWLRSLSSAWTNLRQGSVPHLIVPADADANTEFRSHDCPSSRQRSPAALTFGATDIGGRPEAPNKGLNSEQGDSTALSRSAASESLSRMLSAATLNAAGAESKRTSLPSAVARPGPSRGNVPAFAHEIGRGQIPGEAAASGQSTANVPAKSGPMDEDERRRRRRAEARHQRSKDVTMLPPLLAPSSRSGSAMNLALYRANSYANLHGGSRNRSQSRSLVGADGNPVFTVGSPASVSDYRPQTPALLHAARSTGSASGDEASGHSTSAAAHQDTTRGAVSPRRAGLGLATAMTPIQSTSSNPYRDTTPGSSSSSDHLYSRSFGHGRHGVHHHSNHHLNTHHPHQHHPHHQHYHHPHHQLQHYPPGRAGRHGHHHSFHAGPSLGHIGVLGYHPHGSQPAYGRHNTTPVRTSTPIVPEDGGEMSSAALTGYSQQDEPIHRPFSSMGQRRLSSRSSLQGPPRPKSSMAHRVLESPVIAARHSNGLPAPALHAMLPPPSMPPQKLWSYDNLAKEGEPGVKTYPVLNVPHRQQTHDRYDDTWNEAMDLIARGEKRQQGDEVSTPQASFPTATTATATTKRKQLFHFG